MLDTLVSINTWQFIIHDGHVGDDDGVPRSPFLQKMFSDTWKRETYNITIDNIYIAYSSVVILIKRYFLSATQEHISLLPDVGLYIMF